MHAAVEQYLEDNRDQAGRWRDLAWTADASADGRTARVEVEALVRPPLLSWVLEPWSDGIRIRATSDARAG
ncbi:hypothetical protein [Cellulomonas sp. HZM]|uniref:hypothetical protein n=1 Tax=Cellulomonas sp. HZM TaxID=1454010 RepID=UPI0012DC23A3|nr:hypothetical protein [Cellulomonas sp. HZM]